MKKFLSAILAAAMFCTAGLTLAACGAKGGNGGGSSGGELVMWYTVKEYGDLTLETKNLKKIQEAFNEAHKDEGTTLKIVANNNYSDIVSSFTNGVGLPDITYVDDQYYKSMVRANYITPIDDLVSKAGLDTSSMWENAVTRYRWNKQTNTSNDSDPLYAIPKDINPTVLIYNKTALKTAGITVISVEKEDITGFYAGTKTDSYGKTIDEYPELARYKGAESKDLERGYYSAAKIFNNKVAMSWEELEEFGKVLTQSFNPSSPTTYGFYTEWWFSFGWSVGGDCVGLQNNGEFVFTLNDDAPNYKVVKAVTVNGTSYTPSEAGTFVSYQDKQWLKADASRVTALGDAVQQFPSTRDAFGEFCMLTRPEGYTDPDYGYKGIGITPKCTTDYSTYKKATSQFSNGGLASYITYIDEINAINNVDYDMAPVPVYKEYDDEGNVVKEGKAASQSKSTGYAIATNSKKKELAAKAIKWLATEGQQYMAADGYAIPNSYDLANKYYKNQVDESKNWASVFTSAKTQQAGDWWYFYNREWIANWSQPLNQDSNSVRNNGKTMKKYFDEVVSITNDRLKTYTR